MIARLAILAAAVCLGGCVLEHAGPARQETTSIERDSSEVVRVDLRMGAGKLRVGGGTSKLMRADFLYNVPSWKPYVRYRTAAGHGNLEIEQPGKAGARLGDTKYEWDVRLNQEVPVEMQIHFGAGDARLDLGGLQLRRVEVEMGVGHLEMDLRGRTKRSYDVRIRGGVGEAIIRVPSNVGVYADVQGGIGEIRAPGMHQKGGHYFNDAYEQSKTTIRLDIHGGIGAIRLLSE